MADQTMPERPYFPADALEPQDADGGLGVPVLTATNGSTWRRVVFGGGAVVAAETADGELWVWDQAELFAAVFRAAER